MTTDNLSRRDFIKRSGLTGAGIAAIQMLPLCFLQAQEKLDNPLAHYPNRDWEKLYRNQYAYDREFSWVCAPNDTHNCRVTAHVRNGVIVRMGEHPTEFYLFWEEKKYHLPRIHHRYTCQDVR